MTKYLIKLLFLVFLGIFASNFLNLLQSSLAQSEVVTGTVKISICGNGIVEGGEECDGENLDGQACETLGYQSGTLSCDIACDFDVSGCIPYPTPTPTPTSTMTPTLTSTITPTLTLSPTLTLTPIPISTSTPTPVPEEEIKTVDEEVIEPEEKEIVEVETLLVTTPQPTTTPTLAPSPTPILPPPLRFFDIDDDGKISLSEKVESIKLWVDQWRQWLRQDTVEGTCDLNNDGRCDLRDFSILLYYINRE